MKRLLASPCAGLMAAALLLTGVLGYMIAELVPTAGQRPRDLRGEPACWLIGATAVRHLMGASASTYRRWARRWCRHWDDRRTPQPLAGRYAPYSLRWSNRAMRPESRFRHLADAADGVAWQLYRASRPPAVVGEPSHRLRHRALLRARGNRRQHRAVGPAIEALGHRRRRQGRPCRTKARHSGTWEAHLRGAAVLRGGVPQQSAMTETAALSVAVATDRPKEASHAISRHHDGRRDHSHSSFSPGISCASNRSRPGCACVPATRWSRKRRRRCASSRSGAMPMKRPLHPARGDLAQPHARRRQILALPAEGPLQLPGARGPRAHRLDAPAAPRHRRGAQGLRGLLCRQGHN